MSARRVLIFCTGNSARSQMAEGLLRHLGAGRAGDGLAMEVHSAGMKPGTVRPEAVAVMADLGIDIRSHWSKHVDTFAGQHFDVVMTVCDNARESCPVFAAGTERVHWSFDDPAAVEGNEEERLAAFRRVRDEIAGKLKEWLAGRV
jgi:arsenate reductase (thioredoxin)